MINDLPTITHLQLIYPNIFPTNQCFNCNSTDKYQHWIFCNNNLLIFNIIKNSITEFFTTSKLEISHQELQTLHKQLINHHSLNFPQPFSSSTSIHITLQGLISSDLATLLQPFTNSHKLATQLITKFFHKLFDNIYKLIWIPYCDKFAK